MKNIKFFTCMALLTACCNNGYCTDLIAGEGHHRYRYSPSEDQQHHVKINIKENMTLSTDVLKKIAPYLKDKIENCDENWQKITNITIYGIPNQEINFFETKLDDNLDQFLKREYFDLIPTLKVVSLENKNDGDAMNWMITEDGNIVHMAIGKPLPIPPEMREMLKRRGLPVKN